MLPHPAPVMPEPDDDSALPADPPAALTPGRQELPDMIDILTADHHTIERLIGELDGGPTRDVPIVVDHDLRQDLIDVVIAELMRHVAAEEQHFYPSVRRYLPGGDQLADRELAELARVENLLNELASLDPADHRLERRLDAVIREVRRHIWEEETQLFPGLRAEVDRATLVNLGTDILSAKKLGPTRPHPARPHRPPLNTVAAAVLGLLDLAADILTERPTTVEELRD